MYEALEVILNALIRAGYNAHKIDDLSENMNTEALIAQTFEDLQKKYGTVGALERISEIANEALGHPERNSTGRNRDPIDNIYDQWGNSRNIDPLIVDLDGDGIETIARSAGVHFDHDLSGFAEQSGWINRDDALLARDLNGDGKITSGAELFGDHTRLTNGNFAPHGFAALADLDSNNDGLFSAEDAAFSSIRLWQDRNSDGLTVVAPAIQDTQTSLSY
ncbi:hypothetical protein HBDW_30360 [Herbaspirillum sp. DW155]|uniref:hypothetical protein n=1 Tax=Herbaspirillum sp. DW155 TaxID=3095609 RepID=UPI00308B1933|nr:hypothetical protein HBDW_30360 [Herbaspirillum sp. DW155]